MIPVDEHLKWLRSEIDRLAIKSHVLTNQSKQTRDGKALAHAWTCCGSTGAHIAAYNHLTGGELSVEDVMNQLGIPVSPEYGLRN